MNELCETYFKILKDGAVMCCPFTVTCLDGGKHGFTRSHLKSKRQSFVY